MVYMKHLIVVLFLLSFSVFADNDPFDLNNPFNHGFNSGMGLGNVIGQHECGMDMEYDPNPADLVNQSEQLLPAYQITGTENINRFKEGFEKGFQVSYEIGYKKCERIKKAWN